MIQTRFEVYMAHGTVFEIFYEFDDDGIKLYATLDGAQVTDSYEMTQVLHCEKRNLDDTNMVGNLVNALKYDLDRGLYRGGNPGLP